MTEIYRVSVIGEFREAAIRLREKLIYPTSKCLEIPESTAKIVVAKICDFMATCKCTGSNQLTHVIYCDDCFEAICPYCSDACCGCGRPSCRDCPDYCSDCRSQLEDMYGYSE